MVHQQMRRQHGVITRNQALDAGLSEDQVRSLVRRGTWVSIHRSVFRYAGTPPSWRQRAMAATLATGGLASHRSAVALYDIADFRILEVSTDHTRAKRRVPGVVTHRTTQWRSTQATERYGIPTTGPDRTLLDIAGIVSVDRLERLAEEAVRRRLTTFERLARHLVLNARRGRTGAANLRAMLERRDPTASLPLSDFSRLVEQLLRRAGLPEPKVEFRICDAQGAFIMQADLAWPDRKKAVELDGLTWHFGRNDVERDRRKRAKARAEGWRIQEVLWSMLTDDPEALTELIRRFLLT